MTKRASRKEGPIKHWHLASTRGRGKHHCSKIKGTEPTTESSWRAIQRLLTPSCHPWFRFETCEAARPKRNSRPSRTQNQDRQDARSGCFAPRSQKTFRRTPRASHAWVLIYSGPERLRWKSVIWKSAKQTTSSFMLNQIWLHSFAS